MHGAGRGEIGRLRPADGSPSPASLIQHLSSSSSTSSHAPSRLRPRLVQRPVRPQGTPAFRTRTHERVGAAIARTLQRPGAGGGQRAATAAAKRLGSGGACRKGRSAAGSSRCGV